MKKRISLLLSILLIFALAACGQSSPTWQEQYDLGVRYLSEGNYEEAIIAFTAAIEIDPKQVDAYLKLAEVYVKFDTPEQAVQVLYNGWKNFQNDAQVFEDFLEKLGYHIDKNGTLVSIQDLEESAFSAYREILDTICYGIANQWGGVDFESLGETISYMWYYYPVQSLSDAGYSLLDLNGDAIPELITSVVSDDDWGSAGGMIYDLYTYDNGKVIHLATSGERDRYYLCENSIISNEGSAGAADSLCGFYELLSDSTALHLIELVRYYDVDTPDEPYYYSKKDIYDIQEMEHITSVDAEMIVSKYTRTSLTLTKFDQYISDEKEDAQVSALPDTTVDLLPIDYLGMTTGELSDLLGNDYCYGDGWFLGAAKLIYYTDNRVPLMFYYLDSDFSGIVRGDEDIIIVECSAAESGDKSELAPGIPILATYTQLAELNYEGFFYGEEDAWIQEMSETGLYQFQYDASTSISFYWFNHNDPYTTPAEVTMISRF